MASENGHATVGVSQDAVIFNLSQQVAGLVLQLAMKDAALDNALNRIKELESGRHDNSESIVETAARNPG